MAFYCAAPAAAQTVYDGDYDGFAAASAYAISAFSPTITCPDHQSQCFVGENPGTPPPGFFTVSTNSGSNINFTTANWYAPTDYAHNFMTESYEPDREANDYIQIDFNLTGIHAFGLDVGTYQGTELDFILSNGDEYDDVNSAGFGDTKFIGFTSDDELTSLRVYVPTRSDGFIITRLYVGYPGEVFNIDGVGSTGGVPEPASWAMMLGGFGLAGGAMRRRRATPLPA